MKFYGEVLVRYEFEAESIEQAYDVLYYQTEHPIFPDGIGGCVDDEVVKIVEVV